MKRIPVSVMVLFLLGTSSTALAFYKTIPGSANTLIHQPGYTYIAMEARPAAGEILFLGYEQEVGVGSPWKKELLRPIVLDVTTRQFRNLLSIEQFHQILSATEAVGVSEISADRSMNRLAFNFSRAEKSDFFSEIRVYDLEAGKIVFQLSNRRLYLQIQLSPDGKYLAGFSNSPEFFNEEHRDDLMEFRADLFELATGQLTVLAPECINWVNATLGFQWSPDSRRVVFPHLDPSEENELGWQDVLKIYDLAEGGAPRSIPLEGKRRSIQQVILREHGRILLVSRREIFIVEPDFTTTSTLYRGERVRITQIEGNTLRFLDGVGEAAEAKEILLPEAQE